MYIKIKDFLNESLRDKMVGVDIISIINDYILKIDDEMGSMPETLKDYLLSTYCYKNGVKISKVEGDEDSDFEGFGYEYKIDSLNEELKILGDIQQHDMTPHHVEMWYNKQERAWVIQLMSEDGYQIGDSDYVGGGKELAIKYKNDLEKEHKLGKHGN